HAAEVIFNRVFNGADIQLPRIHLPQGSVKRRGFTRAGRAGDQDNAVRLIDLIFPDGQFILPKSQVVQPDIDRAIVENTHDDLFAGGSRQRGESQVDFSPVHDRADAPVLWQTPLGNVQV